MQVRCPQCHAPVELATDEKLSDIACPSCGSSCSVLGHSERSIKMTNESPWPASMLKALDRPTTAVYDNELVSKSTHAQLSSVLSPRYEMIEADTSGARPTYRARSKSRGIEVTLTHFPAARRDVVTALSQIRTPHIVPMLEPEVLPDGSAVLVVEPRPGRDLLHQITANGGAIPEGTALKWMKQVCEGMTYVAAHNLVHRNLKPANIVIDGAGTAYVDGFDLATSSGTTDGPVGTPAYMPPEHWATSATADVRGDIYGLGATFYHALTGKPPIPSGDGDRAPQRTGRQSDAPHLSAATVRLLERCMATGPSERFQSFIELLTQLDNPAKAIRLNGAPPDLPGYHFLSCLGEGGMGVVYKALRTDSDRRVALKFIRSLGQHELILLARFRIEAEAIACLRHPNIVAVLDIGAFGGYPYFAMEYVDGGSVHDRLGEFSSDPIRTAEVAAGVALGLHHSHRLGILHRDLKPQNILLSQDGVPKLSDFGLAKFTVSGESRDRLWRESMLPGIRGSLMALDRAVVDGTLEQRVAESVRVAAAECDPRCAETVSMDAVGQFVKEAVQHAEFQDTRFLEVDPTRRGDILGTPAYMAPEQTIGDQSAFGPWTDIYSLGVVLYQMLSGRLPFQGSEVNELFHEIRRCPAPRLDRKHPPALASICLRCMAKKPEDRYRTAAELVEDLRHFVSSQGGRQSAQKKWWRFW